jgi:hypothetical protein
MYFTGRSTLSIVCILHINIYIKLVYSILLELFEQEREK